MTSSRGYTGAVGISNRSKINQSPRGLSKNRFRENDQVLLTKVGLKIPEKLSFEDWERAGRNISGMFNLSSWCLGDWLAYGMKNFEDRYRRAIQSVGLQYQTLRNYAWVSRQFSHERRRPQLSFQHHAEVAAFPLEEQNSWLDQAEQMMWTTKQLRASIRDERTGGESEPEVAAVITRIRVMDSRLVRWRMAANQSGIEFENWIMVMLDRAAEQALTDETAVEV